MNAALWTSEPARRVSSPTGCGTVLASTTDGQIRVRWDDRRITTVRDWAEESLTVGFDLTALAAADALTLARVLSPRLQSRTFGSEADLQRLILAECTAAGLTATREVVLSDGLSRIDLTAHSPIVDLRQRRTIGIEVKVKGSAADVQRQLERYAACPELDALVLVTTKAGHLRMPSTMNLKSVVVASLLEGGL